MKLFNNKKMLSMMAVLMMLSFAVSMFAVPNVTAQTNTPTWPFVDAIPAVAGVGQNVLINWGLLNYIPATDQHSGWNVTLQIFDPNGKLTNTTAKTWSTGSVGRRMSFSEPGNYTLRAVYDGESYGTRWLMPSISENITLEIRSDYKKPDHPGHTLPEEYWTRPVDSQLREWYILMGSWVATPNNLYAPYNDAPESAHILWSMPVGDANAGLSGGDSEMVAANNGDAYEGKFASSVIIEGVLYYNREASTTTNKVNQQMIIAVDLHTGKVLWEKNYDIGGSRINRGQILTYINQNNRGAFSYLWLRSGNNMWAINPTTGNIVYNMTDVPVSTFYIGPNGEMMGYTIAYNTTATGRDVVRVREWNSTYVVDRSWPDAGGTGWQWAYQVNQGSGGGPRSYNASVYYREFDISGFTTNPGTSIVAAYPDDRIVFGSFSVTGGVHLTGVALDEEGAGSVIFRDRHFPAPKDWEDLETGASSMQTGWVANSQEDYVAILWTKENRVNYAFSLDTGRFLWQTEPQIFADGWTDSPTAEKNIAYGKLYEASVGGIVYCYDITDGKEVWRYEATDKYNESYHREAWWLIPVAISDGKIYIGHMAHSAQEPKPRGAPFFCLDAEEGTLIWEIDGAFRQTRWGGRGIMGDSTLVTMDTYDQQIYAVGKGPSELTVSAPNVAVTAGTKALITGTVMDVSPGTQQDGIKLRFSNGVPAMSDESQSEWMLYVYKNFEQPMNVKGIEVTVYAYDGENVIDIGKTTSNARGQYSIAWTPDKEGMYDIWAYFEGTAAFYGDDAQATLAVSAAPEVPPPVENPPYEWYIVGAAIIVIVVNLIVALLLRKK